MKLNQDKLIRKYQVGGSIYQPIPTMPASAAPGIPASSPGPQAQQTANEDEDGPLSKKVMEKLSGSGASIPLLARFPSRQRPQPTTPHLTN